MTNQLSKFDGLTIDQCMEVLNCTRSYVYKLIRRNEVQSLENIYPVRISIDSIMTKLRRLYPWLVDKSKTSIDYHLKQLAKPQH